MDGENYSIRIEMFQAVSLEIQHIQFMKFCRGWQAGGVESRDNKAVIRPRPIYFSSSQNKTLRFEFMESGNIS